MQKWDKKSSADKHALRVELAQKPKIVELSFVQEKPRCLTCCPAAKEVAMEGGGGF